MIPALFHPRTLALLAVAGSLAACSSVADRIENIGQAPAMTPIENGPAADPSYVPVRMPMPAPQVAENQPNSLWQPGARAFFRDQRADKVGDILTVLIEIDDQAKMKNETARSRDGKEGVDIPSMVGLTSFLPDSLNPADMMDVGSQSKASGTGSIQRGEKIQLKLAAVVTEVLPNGNLAIFGRQEVRVNFERRDLEIAGVIRPADITSENTVSYDKIAEARISYGGQGQITDVQQPRYGQQLYDILFPF